MAQADSFERQMLTLINQERTSRGIDPLQLELRLNDAAEDYSELMLNRDFFSHTGPSGTSPGDRMEDAGFVFSGNWTWGENIAWQSERGAASISDDVANLHQSLMNSSGHRANILNPDFELIGIGIERGDYNGWDAVMVTQKFATTSASVQIDGGGGHENTPTPAPNNLVLNGNNNSNTLIGAEGNDTLNGRDGADRLIGNSGNDAITAGKGFDQAWGGRGNDRFWGNFGNDTAYGGNGSDKLYGGSGNDRLWGNSGNDTLDGGKGNDKLRGNSGNDSLKGGKGNDTLIGGNGNDYFIFSDGDDVVTDFNAFSSAEKIDLRDVDTISGFSDLRANHLSQVNGNTVIDDGLGNTLTLQNVSSGSLDQGDFLF